MMIVRDPFSWALLSMFGLVGAQAVVGNAGLRRYRSLGLLMVAMFAVGRAILVLPFIAQPRFYIGQLRLIGSLIFASGIIFALAAFKIRPFTGPDATIGLRTTGFYGVVRNPIYFGELLWCLGWAVMFGSIIGIALVPIWWVSLLFLTAVEEDSLEREVGQPYGEYKRRVRGRIIPGLPV
jgi:protein-S-isoprenylcysteine O-methyltransferase Ste14